MVEEQVEVKYIFLHRYIRNTPSDIEVGVPGDTEWTGVSDHQKKNIQKQAKLGRTKELGWGWGQGRSVSRSGPELAGWGN